MAGDLPGAIRAYYQVRAQGGDASYALAGTYAFAPLPTFADSAFKYLRIALASEDTMKPLYDPDLYYLTDDECRTEKGMEPIDDQLPRFNESMQRDFGS